ncbi:MAG TPA: thioredoxin family protein [Gemmatimonadales bacterium]
MITTLLVAACAAVESPPAPADSLVALYERGRTFAEFLAAATRRRETWLKNAAWGQLDGELLARVRALASSWRILVVAADWCGDSANTIPYLATFADSSGGKLHIRIVAPDDGQWVMERHRTSDGRAATPTVVVLDAEGTEVGCWVERPSALASMMREQRAKLSQDDLLKQKYAWLDGDRGKSTVREILDQIEHAAPGQSCGGNARHGEQ